MLFLIPRAAIFPFTVFNKSIRAGVSALRGEMDQTLANQSKQAKLIEVIGEYTFNIPWPVTIY